ncbi:hypothetical protein D9611_002708 [Ephemerocybe angulata]|uniref:Protein phosphatase inhibitor 2 n=1 Tax=Ephemerocybe angulata TaxID=980116 RepID=A0A8H5C1Z2_9AGAR|nr:hypothetical protein D9611_002708 [Tulosesus angulatus]
MGSEPRSVPQHQPHLPPSRSTSSSYPKPKGILKNAPHAPPSSGQQHNLQWDEENLALTEINKDSLMKITEPKTPYVRYNALTDEIEGDIPDFSLSGGYSSQAYRDAAEQMQVSSPVGSPSALAEDVQGPPSRRTSVSSTGRPGTAMSGTSSRSTSFNLPNEARKDIRADGRTGADEVEVDEEMDEETAAKHAAFVRARKGHYSNEAEAMKRAAELPDDEDDSVSGSNAPSDTNDDDSAFGEDDLEDFEPSPQPRGIPPVPPLPIVNGKGSAGPSSSRT